MPEGTCDVTLAIPEGTGPWPGIVMYPDAGGARPVFREMANRLASLGYVVVVPDVYYRSGDWAPFDMAGVFGDKGERIKRIGTETRVELERLLDAKVFIEMWVKVRSGWADDEARVRAFGYE